MSLDRRGQTRQALADRLAEVRAYRGSDAYTAFLRLLMAIDECYSEELRTAELPRLHEFRGASAQCRALQDALLDRRELTTPKI